MSTIVRKIPPADFAPRPRDPWIDAQLDGKLRKIGGEELTQRGYKSARSAASALRTAAGKRGLAVTLAIRGEDVYIQATEQTNGNGKA